MGNIFRTCSEPPAQVGNMESTVVQQMENPYLKPSIEVSPGTAEKYMTSSLYDKHQNEQKRMDQPGLPDGQSKKVISVRPEGSINPALGGIVSYAPTPMQGPDSRSQPSAPNQMYAPGYNGATGSLLPPLTNPYLLPEDL